MNNKILCVDDEESILKGFQLNLRKDFELHLASNGVEGLEVFDREQGFALCFRICECRKWTARPCFLRSKKETLRLSPYY